jgi:flagellar motor switch protein FliM
MGMPEMQVMRALTVNKLRSCFPKREESLKAFEPFFKTIAANISEELQSYSAAPVKCTVADNGFQLLSTAEQLNNGFELAKRHDRLHIWFDVDRGFELTLCELCLGGGGISSHDDEGSRPPTNFERKLRHAVLASLVECIAAAASKVHAVELTTAVMQDDNSNMAEPKPVPCIRLTLLINAFALTGEMQLSFSRQELEKILDISTVAAMGYRTAREVMTDCVFELGVFLKPTEFPLEKIVSLQRGTVLPLGFSVDTPVQIRCEQLHVFEASLNVRQGAIEVILLPGEAESGSTVPMISGQVG